MITSQNAASHSLGELELLQVRMQHQCMIQDNIQPRWIKSNYKSEYSINAWYKITYILNEFKLLQVRIQHQCMIQDHILPKWIFSHYMLTLSTSLWTLMGMTQTAPNTPIWIPRWWRCRGDHDGAPCWGIGLVDGHTFWILRISEELCVRVRGLQGFCS